MSRMFLLALLFAWSTTGFGQSADLVEPPALTWQELLAQSDSLRKVALYDSALVLAERALAITEMEYGKEDTSVARALNTTGFLLIVKRQYDRSESLLKHALEIRERAFGSDHPSVAASLNNIATLYYYQGHLNEAEQLFRRVLEIREHNFGENHPEVGASLHNLAEVLFDEVRYPEAEPLYRRALEIREHSLGSNHLEVAATLNSLAILCQCQGRYSEAEPLYRRALEIPERNLGTDHPFVAIGLNGVANVLNLQGRYAEAEPLYRRATEIWERRVGSDHPNVALNLNNLAAMFMSQGRFSEAEPLYRRALEIRERRLGFDHPDVAMTLTNLADLYYYLHRFNEADSLFRCALAIRESGLGPDHPDLALTLNNLAVLLTEEEKYADAEPLLRRALDIRKRQLGSDHPLVASSLNDLASLAANQGRYAEAEQLFRNALEIRKQTLGLGHPRVAECFSNLARMHAAEGDFLEARDDDACAWRIRRQNFLDGGVALAEKSALECSEFMSKETGTLLAILADGQSQLQDWQKETAQIVFGSKGVVTDAMAARYHTSENMDDTLAARLTDTLKYARFALSKLYVDGPATDGIVSYREKLDIATKEKERVEALLARCSELFRRDKELWDVSPDEVLSAMPIGSAIVEFMRYSHVISFRDTEPRYLAIVLTSGGQPFVFQLGSASAIDTAISVFRQQIHTHELLDKSGYAAATEDLFTLVWKPFSNLLEGASTVFIAPDGNLNLVSFAGLTDETGRYLIEKYPIHYLSTGRDLIRLKHKEQSGTGLLAMGDPDFNMSFDKGAPSSVSAAIANVGLPAFFSIRNARSGCAALKDLKVSPLPGTRSEVGFVTSQWSGNNNEPVLSYLGKDAIEDNFKREAPGKRVIHLATHGYYISEECKPMQSQRSSFSMESGYVGENPLLLSGFLLAGANHHGEGASDANREDGIVTAEEVAGLNLRGTDLVVLSACETGLGEVKSGEGVYGLRRAFQMAGARTVISALWPIDDKATAEFMGQLFSAKDEAMPQTMQRIALNRILSLRSEGKSDHPFYWAAFVATGDWKFH
jgi:CHAT domain-containing protein/Tfp pilus assembly protein PilF